MFLGAQIQTPDAKEMSGIPRSVDDLPWGTVSVRLIRGEFSNNITNHPVELHIGGEVRTANTGDDGRAQFNGLRPGTRVHAVAVVDGERLESREFPAPSQGGIRLMLVATDREKAARAAEEARAPATTGQVVIGSTSQIVVEPDEESVRVYYLLDIMNNARTPVDPPALFMFDTPTGALGTTILSESAPQANTVGTRVRVQGPFPPGKTVVHVAYELPAPGGSVEISQSFPATLEHLAVVAKKVGDTRLRSPQIARQQEMPIGGETFIAAAGEGAIAAGQPVMLSILGLPYHSRAPRRIALAIAGAIALIGVLALRRPAGAEARGSERKRLIARREKLFQDLVRLELECRRGRGDLPHYGSRREELVAALERVYDALETDDTGSEPASRTGFAG